MAYDPRSLGAKCSLCPLREKTPVPGEWRPSAIAVLVGEAPGEKEEEEGRPFVGQAGLELQRNLTALGLKRAQFSVTNVIACRPPENKLYAVERAVKRENEARSKKYHSAKEYAEAVAAGREVVLPTPTEACRPRLMAELRAAARVPLGGGPGPQLDLITLGDVALRTITRHPASIMAVRGGPMEFNGAIRTRLLPTLHPAFVMRKRRWTQAFRADMARAMRWFQGRLEWQDPITIYQPSIVQLRSFLSRPADHFIYDVETESAYPDSGHYDPLRDNLRVIGICTHDARFAVGVPFKSVISGSDFEFYSKPDRRGIAMVLRDEFFGNGAIRKAGWNSGYYDRMVIERHFGVTPKPHLDGIGLHKFAEPELPHGLAYAGSIYTDVSSWKAGRIAVNAETDAELWKYNVTDCAVTALTVEPLIDAVIARGQSSPAKFWPKVQDICVGLHKNGMWIDQGRRAEWDLKLLREARGARVRAREASGEKGLNPGSTVQVGNLLFDRWGLEVLSWTDGGEPSTDDASLRKILSAASAGTLSAGESAPAMEQIRSTVEAIRDYRYAVKLRGTYVTKLLPIGAEMTDEGMAWDEEESWEEREERIRKDRRKHGIVLEDGRVHPDYNAHGTVGWRLSSSGPNAQNWPRKVRDMVAGQDGRLIVGADMDQLELRFATGLSGAKLYLDAFEKGEDPHGLTCHMLYGAAFDQAAGERRKTIRDFGKRFVYAVQYRAEDETVHEVITSAEDDDGRLIYSNLSLRETSVLRRRWLDAVPEFEKWWETEIAEWKREGYLIEPILGQRVDFLDGERGENVEGRIVNFKCQSGGSALVHLATVDFLKEIPFGKWGPGTGPIQQGHDALEVEVPKEHEKWEGEKPEFGYCPPGCGCEANKTARVLEAVMRRDGRPYGLPVTFTASAKIRRRWHEPKR